MFFFTFCLRQVSKTVYQTCMLEAFFIILCSVHSCLKTRAYYKLVVKIIIITCIIAFLLSIIRIVPGLYRLTFKLHMKHILQVRQTTCLLSVIKESQRRFTDTKVNSMEFAPYSDSTQCLSDHFTRLIVVDTVLCTTK